jgi:hypothetical protein
MKYTNCYDYVFRESALNNIVKRIVAVDNYATNKENKSVAAIFK